MPRFDATGPSGAGPRTGGGMGSCVTGASYGAGLGRRARMGFGSFRSPKNQQSALEAEKADLGVELEVLKEELTAIKKETNK
ncbi:MAG: DUF5320 domain-containing protein [Prolixibacteraceae bacterium]|nr:DUF5320 domain-containing protein [Prolixibacteraceae bacterium]